METEAIKSSSIRLASLAISKSSFSEVRLALASTARTAIPSQAGSEHKFQTISNLSA